MMQNESIPGGAQDAKLRTFENMEEYVKSQGGKRVIKKVLAANNGMAVAKLLKSIRSFCYSTFGRENEIEVICMATPEDLGANAEYIRAADQVVHVPGGSNVNNYNNVSLIVEIAQQYKVDAVWAGWGHASENPVLPATLAELGIVFVGPPAGPMNALGDKIMSSIVAQSCGCPMIAWNGSDIRVNYKEDGGVSDEIFDSANVQTVEDAKKQVEKIGVPVMIKASEGGGGKGIRLVDDYSKVEACFRQVQSEVPGSPIFIMRLAERARHLEVQLLADEYGNAIALSGRDCSVQRRHQKILEEGPPVAAKPEVWKQMEHAAVKLAKEVGYVNAGTVEYLYDDNDNFFFLELNPRLQVEHPVTEMITGTNVPAAQLQVAMGIPLNRIPDVRRFYGCDDLFADEPIDFDGEYADEPTTTSITRGHTIAARITAENPFNGFQPTIGQISEINFRSYRNVWGYFSVDSYGRVHEFADSQIGHVFAWGETREEARRSLAMALHDLSIRGEIRTTIEYLKDLIESEDYVNNKFNTAWLDARIKSNIAVSKMDPLTIALVGGVCTAHREIAARGADYMSMLERGQLPPVPLLDQAHAFELIYEGVKYKLNGCHTGENTYRLYCNGSHVDAELRCLADGGFLVLIGGRSHVAYVKEDVGAQRYTIDGQTCLFEDEYDPTQMRAQMGGKLLRYLVEDGASLEKGDGFAEIEVMKMNMTLSALEAGTITLHKPEGAVMEPGDMICTMELKDPSKVQKAKLFEGTFPALGEPWPQTLRNMPHHTLERAQRRLEAVMAGFAIENEVTVEALKSLRDALHSPLLPVLEIEGIVSRTKHALPKALLSKVESLCRELRSKEEPSLDDSAAFAAAVLSAAQEHPPAQVGEILSVAESYKDGLSILYARILGKLIASFVEVEAKFAELENSDAADKDDVLQELRTQNAGDLPKVQRFALAHHSRKPRDTLVLAILEELDTLQRGTETRSASPKLRSECANIMHEVAALQGIKTTDVALEARQSLIEMEHSYEDQLKSVTDKLKRVMQGDESAREELVQSTEPVLAYLMDIVSRFNENPADLRQAALRVYVSRVYAAYKVVDASTSELTKNNLACDFTFFSEATDSVQVGGGGSGLANVSSFEDLTKVLSNNGDFDFGATNESNRSDAETSSVGMDLDIGGAAESSAPASGLSGGKSMLARQGGDFKARSASVEGPASSTVPPYVNRKGKLLFFADMAELEENLASSIKDFAADTSSPTPLNVVHVIFGTLVDSETDVSAKLYEVVQKNKDVLSENLVRRITFAVVRSQYEEADRHVAIVAGHGGHFFTFRNSSGYEEDRLVRNIETPLAFQLDLERMSNFNIRMVPIGRSMSRSQAVHVYEATPKANAAGKVVGMRRFFVRALVRDAERVKLDVGTFDAYPGPERVFVQALRALESVQDDSKTKARKNHIFMNVLSDSATVDAAYVEGIIRTLHRRYAKRLISQNVEEFEIRVNAVLAEGAPSMPIRVIASNPTGFALNIDTYVEASDPSGSQDAMYYSISEGDGGLGGALAAMGLGAGEADVNAGSTDSTGSLHGKPLHTPYPVSDEFDERRARARAASTTFAYDFPDLFRKSLEFAWREHLSTTGTKENMPPRKSLVEAEELVLDDEFEAGDAVDPVNAPRLCRVERKAGRNPIGMVAWRFFMRTPQYPRGREVVVIANDITVKAGSFGTREDMLFDQASKYARLNGLPRLYIAANSGARIGMADEVKRAFQVKWINEADPTKGYEYIYVNEDTFNQLGPDGRKSLLAEKVEGTDHFRINAIVGESPDLGVENLRGSGTIAGETARAYEESFTLSYVSGRSVGIGAYLVRLGQRIVQKGKNAPILLTGYQALNSLMGREVYTSNLQLGGTKVMFANGVSHQSVRHDLEGVASMVKWLSYVPERRGAPLPLTALVSGDRIDRDVEVHPRDLGSDYDPRTLLTGLSKEDGSFLGGFFDKDSFTETLSGWARTVIAGRARLGKLPMGVIISEIRTVEARAPADPAAPESQELIWNQAGQVWFPDSSYKTAQAINDFNREGLPLMLFANWRGFSGGTRDMFDQIVKFGAYIVDALVAYKQPVFVYIPPFGELRGGAWVVVDETINPSMMEMYADTDARGGVLEPAGVVSIKYRAKDVLATAHRVDEKLKGMVEKLKAAAPDSAEAADLKKAIAEREKLLMPIFKQIAVHFGDLHDRPGRMQAKGVIRSVVPWSNSRRHFYNRLRRRLAELDAVAKIDEVVALSDDLGAPSSQPLEILESVFNASCDSSVPDWNNDKTVHEWLVSEQGQQAVSKHLAGIKADAISDKVTSLGMEDPKAILKGLMGVISKLRDEEREEERAALVNLLRKGSLLLN
ncbi:Acetyl-CoA carboxylase [Hondaea fermentalgiana]|uniref:Acetyl-CoA carboxylase n=1 Tax=Hondaea fermentalgiana TaxID=2315210 RepID=A0A2R5GG45_9STRA|nr:Acetyl-CoA carboxylase [Hondaea fermentalgiana]|eukprot:GBG29850.1 Acetyl-CoA carboxylase [Hondaea fermentalgiana]